MSEIDTYIASKPPAFARALAGLRANLWALLPDHIECMSYAMPGFRAPGPKGKMVVGYAAFTRHIGLYPHSGSIMPQIDCTPFKTSKSGLLFAPDTPPPLALITKIIRARQDEIGRGYPHNLPH
jgi:uncharacterized protein YdhG (YjbR/CyaY superfamily)